MDNALQNDETATKETTEDDVSDYEAVVAVTNLLRSQGGTGGTYCSVDSGTSVEPRQSTYLHTATAAASSEVRAIVTSGTELTNQTCQGTTSTFTYDSNDQNPRNKLKRRYFGGDISVHLIPIKRIKSSDENSSESTCTSSEHGVDGSDVKTRRRLSTFENNMSTKAHKKMKVCDEATCEQTNEESEETTDSDVIQKSRRTSDTDETSEASGTADTGESESNTDTSSTYSASNFASVASDYTETKLRMQKVLFKPSSSAEESETNGSDNSSLGQKTSPNSVDDSEAGGGDAAGVMDNETGESTEDKEETTEASCSSTFSSIQGSDSDSESSKSGSSISSESTCSGKSESCGANNSSSSNGSSSKEGSDSDPEDKSGSPNNSENSKSESVGSTGSSTSGSSSNSPSSKTESSSDSESSSSTGSSTSRSSNSSSSKTDSSTDS